MTREPLIPLRIDDGYGDFYVTRFRIYFQPDQAVPLDQLVSGLVKDFIEIFNGVGLEPNVATAERPGLEYKGKPTLRLAVGVRTLMAWAPLIDAHSDWLGETWSAADQGFAVETLSHDSGTLDANPKTAQGLALTGPGFQGEAIKLFAHDTGNNHLMAGRRSWIIGRATDLPATAGMTEARQRVDAGQAHRFITRLPTCFLETAAIERFSVWLYAAASDITPCLRDLQATATRVWTTMLANYVSRYKLRPLQRTPNSHIWPEPPQELRGAKFIIKSFKSKQDCLGQAWVQELMSLHPGLKE